MVWLGCEGGCVAVICSRADNAGLASLSARAKFARFVMMSTVKPTIQRMAGLHEIPTTTNYIMYTMNNNINIQQPLTFSETPVGHWINTRNPAIPTLTIYKTQIPSAISNRAKVTHEMRNKKSNVWVCVYVCVYGMCLGCATICINVSRVSSRCVVYLSLHRPTELRSLAAMFA